MNLQEVNKIKAINVKVNKKWKYKSRLLQKIIDSYKINWEAILTFFALVKNYWKLINRISKNINWTYYSIVDRLIWKWFTIKNYLDKNNWIFYNHLTISNYILNVNWYYPINVVIVQERIKIKNKLKLKKVKIKFIDLNTNEFVEIDFFF